MKTKHRYVRVTAPMVFHLGNGLLSYQELCVLIFMLIYCGVTDGHRNPYKLGRKGIADALNISDSRVKQVLATLERKGFVRPVYRIIKPDETSVETESLRQARKLKLSHGGGFMRTFYYVSKKPVFSKKTTTQHDV